MGAIGESATKLGSLVARLEGGVIVGGGTATSSKSEFTKKQVIEQSNGAT